MKINTWEDFFDYFYRSENEVLIIDEFQYLYMVNRAWPTILQRWWEKFKDTNKKIILCGTIISTIYKIAKRHGGPLYGRKTYEIVVESLRYHHIRAFLPEYGIKDLILLTPYFSIIYAVVSGYRKFNEISQISKISSNKLPKYLSVLERVRIVKKDMPLTEKKLKSKNTRYKIKDNFFCFWFRFVAPY